MYNFVIGLWKIGSKHSCNIALQLILYYIIIRFVFLADYDTHITKVLSEIVVSGSDNCLGFEHQKNWKNKTKQILKFWTEKEKLSMMFYCVIWKLKVFDTSITGRLCVCRWGEGCQWRTCPVSRCAISPRFVCVSLRRGMWATYLSSFLLCHLTGVCVCVVEERDVSDVPVQFPAVPSHRGLCVCRWGEGCERRTCPVSCCAISPGFVCVSLRRGMWATYLSSFLLCHLTGVCVCVVEERDVSDVPVQFPAVPSHRGLCVCRWGEGCERRTCPVSCCAISPGFVCVSLRRGMWATYLSSFLLCHLTEVCVCVIEERDVSDVPVQFPAVPSHRGLCVCRWGEGCERRTCPVSRCAISPGFVCVSLRRGMWATYLSSFLLCHLTGVCVCVVEERDVSDVPVQFPAVPSHRGLCVCRWGEGCERRTCPVSCCAISPGFVCVSLRRGMWATYLSSFLLCHLTAVCVCVIEERDVSDVPVQFPAVPSHRGLCVCRWGEGCERRTCPVSCCAISPGFVCVSLRRGMWATYLSSFPLCHLTGVCVCVVEERDVSDVPVQFPAVPSHRGLCVCRWGEGCQWRTCPVSRCAISPRFVCVSLRRGMWATYLSSFLLCHLTGVCVCVIEERDVSDVPVQFPAVPSHRGLCVCRWGEGCERRTCPVSRCAISPGFVCVSLRRGMWATYLSSFLLCHLTGVCVCVVEERDVSDVPVQFPAVPSHRGLCVCHWGEGCERRTCPVSCCAISPGFVCVSLRRGMWATYLSSFPLCHLTGVCVCVVEERDVSDVPVQFPAVPSHRGLCVCRWGEGCERRTCPVSCCAISPGFVCVSLRRGMWATYLSSFLLCHLTGVCVCVVEERDVSDVPVQFPAVPSHRGLCVCHWGEGCERRTCPVSCCAISPGFVCVSLRRGMWATYLSSFPLCHLTAVFLFRHIAASRSALSVCTSIV